MLEEGDTPMIDPKEFYDPHDSPTGRQKEQIWASVENAIAPRRTPLLTIADRRSFYYGIAAAVVLYCAGIGVFQLVSDAYRKARPDIMKMDDAYQSAIMALEQVVPAVLTSARQEPVRERLNSRIDQLRMIDEAIAAMKQETHGSDLSPMNRASLRDLYSLKLKILQQMLEQGEIVP